MTKTTVYLPDDLKKALERLAATSGRSEAQVIRDAIATLTTAARRARPRGGLFVGDDPGLSERVNAVLAGFGER